MKINLFIIGFFFFGFFFNQIILSSLFFDFRQVYEKTKQI